MNLNIFSYILLALFVITAITVYLSVRRGQINTVPAMLYGGIVNVIVITLFLLSVGIDFWRAVLIGVAFGATFNAITATAAAYFLKNERAKQAE